MLIALPVSIIATLLAILALVPFARKIGLVDVATGRKNHVGHIPLIGGLSIAVGFVCAFFWLTPASEETLWVLAATLFLLLIGIADDLFGLGWRSRLAAQIVATGLVMTTTELQLSALGSLPIIGTLSAGYLAPLLTILAVVGLTNAFNLIDGIDGLAGSMALISIFAIITFQNGLHVHNLEYLAVMAAALLPYLYFNMFGGQRYKIFLGDAGSTALGFVIAWTLINQTQSPGTGMAPSAALWCVAIPVLDTIGVMFRRMRKGQSPFMPDRMHLHHILMRVGLSPKASLALLTCAACSLAFVGLVFNQIAPNWSSLGFVCAFCLYAWGLSNAWKVTRMLKRRRVEKR